MQKTKKNNQKNYKAKLQIEKKMRKTLLYKKGMSKL